MTKKKTGHKGSGGGPPRKRGDGERNGGKKDRNITPAMWDVLESLAEASEERAKKKEKSEIATSVIEQLRRSGALKKEFMAPGESDDSSDAEGFPEVTVRESKYKKMKETACEQEAEVKRLQASKAELDALKASADKQLNKKPEEAEKHLSSAEWSKLKEIARETAAPKRVGLFDSLYEEMAGASTTSSSAETLSIAETLKKKLTLAEQTKALSERVQVNTRAESHAKEVAKLLAEKYFKSPADLETLVQIKNKFLPESRAQYNNTILTALLRACISRKVHITDTDLGLG